MDNFVENLRKKSVKSRIKIMWACVCVCMIVVMGIWFVNFKDEFQQSENVRGTSLKGEISNLIEKTNISNIKAEIQTKFDRVLGEKEGISDELNSDETKLKAKVYKLPLEDVLSE